MEGSNAQTKEFLKLIKQAMYICMYVCGRVGPLITNPKIFKFIIVLPKKKGTTAITYSAFFFSHPPPFVCTLHT